MSISIQPTDNPNIIKYTFEQTISQGSFEFNRETENLSPMVQQLFAFPFITQIFITANFIAVEKVDNVKWNDVQDGLKEMILMHAKNRTILPKTTSKAVFSLYAEITPNPAAMKFVANQILVDFMVEVKSTEETKQVPLAEALFELPYVTEVFISENYISVLKDESVEWQEKTLEVRELILNHLRSGKEVVSSDYQAIQTESIVRPEREFTDIELKIKDILEEYLKPAVAGDGGNIDLIEFDTETKTAHMLLQGSCSGCPSSTVTLKNGIQTMLTQMLPGEVSAVEAVNG